MPRIQALRPHFLSFAAGLAVAFLIAILTSAASPGLAIGVADNNAFKPPDPRGVAAADDLGFSMVRVFVWYKPGQTALTLVQKQRLAQALAAKRRSYRLLVSVTGKPVNPPDGWNSTKGITTATGREEYVRFLVNLVRTFPAVKDVSIWNEPNYPLFWSSRYKAPQRYAALLAASYDALHRHKVRIYGFELHPWREPVKWIRTVGSWMRATHRKRPLFDYVATHPYPRMNTEVPWAHHSQPGVLSMGDVHRLRKLLRTAFRGTGQKRFPIAYTETGWTTASVAHRVTPALQAKRMAQALDLAYCQRGVHAFISFLLLDGNDYWQTGFFSAGWSVRKPVYGIYKREVARVRAGRVDCSRFPRAVL
jgi:hypothetical protein